MKTQLLCTFTINKSLRPTVDLIVDTYDVLFNKIFVLKSVDTSELMCTYNVDSSQPLTILDNTISLHRKKHTNNYQKKLKKYGGFTDHSLRNTLG